MSEAPNELTIPLLGAKPGGGTATLDYSQLTFTKTAGRGPQAEELGGRVGRTTRNREGLI